MYRRLSAGGNIHRVIIRPVPYYFDSKSMQKSIEKAGISCVHVLKKPKDTYAEIFFESIELRDSALEKFDDLNFRRENRNFTVEITDQEYNIGDLKKEANKNAVKKKKEESLKISDCRDAVTPLWNVPYDQQLKRKQEIGRVVVRKIYKNLKFTYGSAIMKKCLPFADGKHICNLEDIISDKDAIHGYRNKHTLSIGKNLNGEFCIGFKLGAFEEYGEVVGGIEECQQSVPEFVIQFVEHIKEFMVNSKYDACDVRKDPDNLQNLVDGVWRLLLIRFSSTTKEVMVGVQANDANFKSSEELENLQKSFVEHLLKYSFNNSHVLETIVWQNYSGISSAAFDHAYEILYGKGFITDSVQDVRFRIQPNSFFQVNGKMAEKLYSKVQNWISFNKNPEKKKKILIDICCGTGTIGLGLAGFVDKIYGLELNPEAISDAKYNARLNGISNAEFLEGRAEITLPELMQKLKLENDNSREIIAIVDPPREGLHRYVIRAIRECPLIDQLIYVSCNPKTMVPNVESLMRHECSKRKGIPFQAVRSVVVDMFPHTEHCEMIVQLNRSNSDQCIYSPYTSDDSERISEE
jgi:tRNA (uracil-5-)-methyltransferase